MEREKKKVIITVGCEYGCGGPALAQKIASDYGIPCYDRDLIDDIIEEAGFSKDLLDKAENAKEIRGRDLDVNPKKLGAIKYHNLTDRVVFLQRETVRRLAARGSCVFVGRCADHILRHADVKTLNVFIYAPYADRLANCVGPLKMDKRTAKKMIAGVDKARAAYHRYWAGYPANDPEHNHIIINSALLEVEGTAQALAAIARVRFHLTGSQGGEDDATAEI